METTENKGLTIKRERIVEALASGNADTFDEAAKIAGVHRATLHRARKSATVQHALQKKLSERTDKARGIMQKAARAVSVGLDGDVPVHVAAMVWKASADVVATGVEADEEPVTDHERAGAYARRLRDFEAGIRWERRRQSRLSGFSGSTLEASVLAVTTESS